MTNGEQIEAHFVNVCQVLGVLRKHPLPCNGAEGFLFATELEYPG